MKRPVVDLTKDLTAAIRAGHPWVFDRAVGSLAGRSPGDVVAVRHRGTTVGVGFADPGSPIAVRMLSLDGGLDPDAGWAESVAGAAAAMRAADPRLAGCDGVRLIHGENDGMPGLVIDSYAGYAAVVFDGAGARGFWRPRLDRVLAGLAAGGFPQTGAWLRRQGRRGGGGELAAGEAPPDTVTIVEHDARFEVDIRRGQKTGFFLDQRDNRVACRDLAAGAEVLNLFGYTGGFSVHAALGGAARVTTVDIAAPAIEAAGRNFAANGLGGHHRFVADDAFAFIAEARRRGERYDLVICDPPSFAPSAKARGQALGAYRKLNRAVLDVVAPGGHLVTASCSSHVGEADLIDCVARAGADAGRGIRLREICGAATDHPVRPGFAEGRYLSALFAWV